MGEYWNLERLTQEWEARGLSRRDLMKLIGAGAGGAAITQADGASRWRVRSGASKPPTATGGEVSVLWRGAVTLNPLYSSLATSSMSSGQCSERWSR